MSKGPWITDEVKRELDILALFDEPRMSLNVIQRKLTERFLNRREIDIIALSTIEKRVRQTRKKAREMEQETKLEARETEQETKTIGLDCQPWSMILNEKAGIPFDPLLLRLLKLWFRRQVELGQKPPFVPFSVGIAKWAVRLHKMAPFLVEEDEQQLLYRARRYFAMERMAALAGKSPDSSFDDLEIVMKNETNQELKVAYKEFFGRTIKLEGEKVQTENGEASEIIVPTNMTERIGSRKKKHRKTK